MERHSSTLSLHERIDSLMVEQPGSSTPATQITDSTPKTTAPSTAHLWYSLMVACQKRLNTLGIVEDLIHLIDPGIDVPKLMTRIGDPAQKVPEEEFESLDVKLRTLLFPEWEKL